MALKYMIVGGEEDGKIFDMDMAPCSDFNFFKARGIEQVDLIAKAHIEADQFFCPSAFDMSFYGSADDIVKKVLFLDIKITEESYLEGKHLAMLINTREIEFFDEYERVELIDYTKMMWMPINSRSPMSNLVTFTNHEFYMKETEMDQYKISPDTVEKIDWISIDENVQSSPYGFPLTNPTVKS